MNVTCKVDYSQFQALAKGFPTRFKARLAKAANLSGNYIQAQLLQALAGQTLGWQPLSALYLHWKMLHGFDTRILIRSTLMMQSIRFRRQAMGGWVGIPAGLYYPANLEFFGGTKWGKGDIKRPKTKKSANRMGRSIADVMSMHESGRSLGHRPLFEPVSHIVEPGIRAFYVNALRESTEGGGSK